MKIKKRGFINFVRLLLFLSVISCENKKEHKAGENSKVKTDSVKNSTIEKTSSKIEFESYSKEGILLEGTLPVFDENLVKTGELEINEISTAKISAKSKEIYNIGKSKDYCLKSNFVKINFNGKELLIFGQGIYEIDKGKKFAFQNDKKDNFLIFPVTNFEMGASDDEDLTGCDDFSYLIIADKNGHFHTISSPKNQGNRSRQKFATLVHDDGMLEQISDVKIINDSLIIKVHAKYQEGSGSYNLNTSLKDNFLNSTISKEKNFTEPIHHR